MSLSSGKKLRIITMAKKNNRQQDPNDSSDSGDTNTATTGM